MVEGIVEPTTISFWGGGGNFLKGIANNARSMVLYHLEPPLTCL